MQVQKKDATHVGDGALSGLGDADQVQLLDVAVLRLELASQALLQNGVPADRRFTFTIGQGAVTLALNQAMFTHTGGASSRYCVHFEASCRCKPDHRLITPKPMPLKAHSLWVLSVVHARHLAVALQALGLQLTQAGAQSTTSSRGVRSVGAADLAHTARAIDGNVGEAEEHVLRKCERQVGAMRNGCWTTGGEWIDLEIRQCQRLLKHFIFSLKARDQL